ncbi:hypothetical protein GCM10010221_26820 [Streptomyces parvus]|uniref:hypothetical protein n=1 Tax=Streptomyces parvus TaxID=66428 RepID=UPI00142EAB84|nr:hypothetical protein [Streptomyces parvus]GGS27809.1 hypothetical protein GCM10010221_26820 [Streptomyces parvus]
MSAKRNAPGATGALRDQLDGGSATTVARASVIAHCRAYAARGCFGRYWVLVIDTCPHCAERHTHGGGPGRRPSFGHRLAHCGGSPAGRGYWLEPTTEEAA